MTIKQEKDRIIRFFLVGEYTDHIRIMNAESEQEVYKLVTGDEWPEDGPNEEEWECTEIMLHPGQVFDLVADWEA